MKTIIIIMVLLVFSVSNGMTNTRWKNSLSPKGIPAKRITIASDGNALYEILIPSVPTTQDIKAAKDLTHWLNEITGAKYIIRKDTEMQSDE
ncbi:MAG: hypothetical protein ACYC0V_17700, partial [Armatimonadota bacterium]